MNIHICTDHGLIPPYAIMLMLSFAAGLAIQFILNVKGGIKRNIAAYGILLAMPMSIFFALLLTYISTVGKAFGISSIGGAVGMYVSALTMAAISRRRESFGVMLRSCTLSLPMMYSVSKIGCLLGGCCRGMDYSGVMCVEYSGERMGHLCAFPVQIAESAAFLAIFMAGMVMYLRRSRNAVPAVFLLSAGAKFALDFLRVSHTGKVISLNQLLCAAAAAVCVAVIVLREHKSRGFAERAYN